MSELEIIKAAARKRLETVLESPIELAIALGGVLVCFLALT